MISLGFFDFKKLREISIYDPDFWICKKTAPMISITGAV